MDIVYNIKKIIPDKMYIRMQYFKHFHCFPSLKNPKTFNEKLQWLKLYDRRPEYTMMVDKYEVRRYIAEKIGEEYLIPLLGVWDSVEDINFTSLPNRFVLKCTHDSGSVIICRDKSNFNIEETKIKLSKAMKKNAFYYGREWPYKNVKQRIIAEKYMVDESGELKDYKVNWIHSGKEYENDLTDYKFYCFDGMPQFLYVSQGLANHETAQVSFLTLKWKFAPYGRTDFMPFAELPPKPLQFEAMKEIASELSKGHRFLRVDLYQISGKIYFSELTFAPGSGLMPFSNPQHDEEVGKLLRL